MTQQTLSMEPTITTTADLMFGLVLLLMVAAFTTIVCRQFPKIPLTVALVVVGMLIAAAGDQFFVLALLNSFELTPELVLYVFIPTLVFESAISLDARQLSRNLVPILTLAIPGLLISTGIIGLIFYLLANHLLGISIEPMVALLLGAILSATDPVAVISIFRQLGVPERLTVLVEGESLFNDATSLVLATILIGLLLSGDYTSGIVFSGAGEFLLVFTGGALIGLALALLAGFVLGQIEADPAIEITLTTILAYCSFIIAEHVFHVSGIMAVVAAGLTLGSWGRSKISPSIASFMTHFWEYLAYVANTLIFLMVGLQIDLASLAQSVDLIAVVVLAMLISRALVVFGVVPWVERIPGAEKISLPFKMVMYWGGLRGAIALAIVLSLPNFEFKDLLVAVVMGAVLFTLLVQGLTIELMVKWLRLDELSLPDKLAKVEGNWHARQEGLARLTQLVDGGVFSNRVAENVQARCQRELDALAQELDDLNHTMSSDQVVRVLALRCLSREKARVYELFARGLINEWAFRALDHTITVQIDQARHAGLMPTAEIEATLPRRLVALGFSALAKIGLATWLEHWSTLGILRDYEVAWGRYRAANSVLNSFDQITDEGHIDERASNALQMVYQSILEKTMAQLDEVAEQYPEFVESIQEQLGQRLMLIAEHESVARAADLGMISSGIADSIMKEQLDRIRQLKQGDLSAALEIDVDEILQRVPMFKALDASDRSIISRYLKRRTITRGTRIITMGDKGESMFLIARGIANVELDEGSGSEKLVTLYAGDFFGESALLNDAPRNASTVAATPCSLYELRRHDLVKIFELVPGVKKAVEEVDRDRLSSNTVSGFHPHT